MSSICPVCNGLQELQTNCPVCSHRMYDHGKLSDLLGPYSPYETDDITLSTRDSSHPQEHCLHFMNCPECHSSFTQTITTV